MTEQEAWTEIRMTEYRIEDARHVATYQPGNGREIAQCRDCADTHRYTD